MEIDFTTGRNLKTFPLFSRLEDNHAYHRQIMGFEKPFYFKTQQQVDGTVYSCVMSIDSPTYSLSLFRALL